MDIEQIYDDYSVDHKSEGHKHTRDGWVNSPCPWCSSGSGHDGYHLGYNLQGDFFTCWRCGFHPTASTLVKLLNLSEREVYAIIKQYGSSIFIPKSEKVIKVGQKILKLPSNCSPMAFNHIKYLKKRGYDPAMLEQKWKLLGSGPISLLKTEGKQLDYKHRIIIPFIWDDDIVSFDSRDITGKSPYKYMACPESREKISHKDILYGDQTAWGDQGIIVEGPTDVWRFGDQSCATSGIKYKPKQVRLIAGFFKRIFVCFDGQESQALIAANELVADLKFRGKDAIRVDITDDPGSMSQEQASNIVNELLNF